MNSSRSRRVRWYAVRRLAPVLVLALATGCISGKRDFQQAAQQRWNGMRADVKLQLAADQLDGGNLDAAAAALEEARRLDPALPDLPLMAVRLDLARGRVTRAEARLRQLPPAIAAGAEAAYLRGLVAQQQSQWAAAASAYQTALERNPAEFMYFTATVQTLLQLDRLEEAGRLLAEYEPRHGWTTGYQALVAERAELAGDAAEAADAWQRVIDGDEGTDQELLRRCAAAQMRAGRAEAAATLLRMAFDRVADPEASLRLQYADCLLETHKPIEARRVVSPLLQRDRRHAGALQRMIRAFVQEGDADRACGLAARLLRVSNHDAAALETAAAVHYHFGRRDLARQYATRLIALEPDNPIGLRVLGRPADSPAAVG